MRLGHKRNGIIARDTRAAPIAVCVRLIDRPRVFAPDDRPIAVAAAVTEHMIVGGAQVLPDPGNLTAVCAETPETVSALMSMREGSTITVIPKDMRGLTVPDSIEASQVLICEHGVRP